MGHRKTLTRLLPVLVFAALALILAGCSEDFSSPQNTFAPAGEPAESQKFDFLFVMWPALAIMILVLGGVLAICIKYRHKEGDKLPKQVHGNTPLELSWTIGPALLMAVVAVPTVDGIRDLGRDPADDAFKVNVTGIQWAWQFEYPDVQDQSGAPYSEIGELHIPVGREIGFTITSNDVNHSFWIPRLAGKTDAIANHPNQMWIRADKPGTYEGQCAEFCGIGHSAMRLRVIAMEQAEFDAWVQEATSGGEPPPEGSPSPEATPGAGETPAAGETPGAEPTETGAGAEPTETGAGAEPTAADGE